MAILKNLVESRRRSNRNPTTALVSALMHGGLIFVAVFATAQAAVNYDKPKQEDVEYVDVKKTETPPPEKIPETPAEPVAVPPPPQGHQILVAAIEVPDVLPDIDLSKKLTDPDDYSGTGVKGGRANGVPGGKPVPLDSGKVNEPKFVFEVDKPAESLPGNPTPRYPDILRQAGVQGEVIVQFVVDTSGRPQMSSLKIMKTSHDLFATAVKNNLPSMRFIPAQIGQRKVPQIVQLPFGFSISK